MVSGRSKSVTYGALSLSEEKAQGQRSRGKRMNEGRILDLLLRKEGKSQKLRLVSLKAVFSTLQVLEAGVQPMRIGGIEYDDEEDDNNEHFLCVVWYMLCWCLICSTAP